MVKSRTGVQLSLTDPSLSTPPEESTNQVVQQEVTPFGGRENKRPRRSPTSRGGSPGLTTNDNPTGATNINVDGDGDGNLSNSKRRLNSQKARILRYPDQEIYNTTDYLQIAIVGYKPIAENNPGSNRNKRLVGKPGSRRNGGKERFATIFLPIPSNIQDGNSVSYSNPDLNGITEMIAGFSLDTMVNIGKAVGQGNIQEAQTAAVNAFKSAGAKIDIDGGTAVDLITKKLTSMAAGTFGGNLSVSDLLNRQQGVILNPNIELLFNGPTLRSFKFSFKMTPRSQREAEEVKQIINTFKRNMVPKVVTTGNNQNLFLKTPNVFELTYKQGNDPHSFLHKFKQCFLENMSVNYTGEGTYATYGDGVPISLIMDLQFKELEPIYDIDYEDVYSGPLADSEKAFRSTGVGY